ncbi:hypothetical protein PC116_g34825, partial [Phytophthora cactorum]
MVHDDGKNNNHMWILYEGGIYDLTNYFTTIDYYKNLAQYNFLDADMIDTIKDNPGQDVTSLWTNQIEKAKGNKTALASKMNSLNCIKETFYVGIPDFRDSAQCQANNY